TLDREVELLKRTLNYSVRCGKLAVNPIATTKLLRKPNVRKTVISEVMFAKLYESAEPNLKPILLIAYDTGLRKREGLDLRWAQRDLDSGGIRLGAGETKTDSPRVVVLTGRAIEVLKAQPRHIKSEYVFVNPATGEPWQEIRKMFRRACEVAGLEGIWVHDLR